MSIDEKLKNARKELEKKFGKGSAIIPAEGEVISVERWDIESLKIRDLLGGGLPKGRILELYGPESAGKTSLACYLAGQVQKDGGSVAFVDAEHALDLDHSKIFMNPEEILFLQPDSGEQALGQVQMLAEQGIDLIIVDSVAALTPQAEIDGEMTDQQMGLQARMLGKGLRKITAILGRTKTTVIFINQIRMKIGVLYGNPECVTPDTLIEVL